MMVIAIVTAIMVVCQYISALISGSAGSMSTAATLEAVLPEGSGLIDVEGSQYNAVSRTSYCA